MNFALFALLVACVAGSAQGFVPTSLGSVAEVQRQNYRLQALNVRMQGEGRTDRRSILLRGACLQKATHLTYYLQYGTDLTRVIIVQVECLRFFRLLQQRLRRHSSGAFLTRQI
jgi:hypothetical protein